MTAGASWSRRIRDRIIAHWLLKMLGTTAGITAFMWLYFLLLLNPQFPVTIMPLTPLDRWIGFEPWTLIPYASLWLYISLVPALLLRAEFAPYLRAVALLSVAGLGIFLLFPTAVPAPAIDWTRYPTVQFLKSVDASGNACPSLHVAFSVLTAIWLNRLLRHVGAPRALPLANAGWCLLIVYSTLATKQHVAVDAATGALLGATVAFACLRSTRWSSARQASVLEPTPLDV